MGSNLLHGIKKTCRTEIFGGIDLVLYSLKSVTFSKKKMKLQHLRLGEEVGTLLMKLPALKLKAFN